MASSITPFLMFQGTAEAALSFYVSLFADARVEASERWAEGEPGKAGAFKLATLALAGQRVRIFDSPSPHAFAFTPSFSFFVECEDAAEIDRLAAALGDGGQAMMPLGEYGFSRKFAWLSDRFGVSWQLNLS